MLCVGSLRSPAGALSPSLAQSLLVWLPLSRSSALSLSRSLSPPSSVSSRIVYCCWGIHRGSSCRVLSVKHKYDTLSPHPWALHIMAIHGDKYNMVDVVDVVAGTICLVSHSVP